MNKLILVLIAMAFVAASCNQPAVSTPKTTVVATIGKQQLNVEIADTEKAREQGLSNRDSMPDNDGMLFKFEQAGLYSFWMKDTRFPLDFIWIMGNQVVQITADVPTQLGVLDQQLKLYIPDQPVNQVLEVNAGWAAKNGIKVGDSISLTNP